MIKPQTPRRPQPPPETREPVAPHMLVMWVVFVGALALAFFMLPGEGHRIAALERDGHYRRATSALEAGFQSGDRRVGTLHQLHGLYELQGDLAKARETLELLVQQQPRDPKILRQLGQYYKLTQNEDAYIANLQQQLDVRFSDPACRELIGLLRLKGDSGAEQRTIEACLQRGYRRAEDVVRLAFLLAADGKMDRSAQLLRSVDDRRLLKADRERLLLFTSMLDTNEAVEAKRRAARWLRGAPDESLALLLIEHLAGTGRFDLAIELARDISVAGDTMSLVVGRLMVERGEVVAARTYLRGWLERSPLDTPKHIDRFISTALDATDAEIAFKGASRYGLQKLGQDQLSELAEALGADGRRAEFRQVRSHLADDTLKGNPLLAAAVALERGAAMPARVLLSRVDVTELDEWRLALWARLMETTGQRPAAAQALEGIAGGQATGTLLSDPQRIVRASRVRVRPARRNRVRTGPGGQPPGAFAQPPVVPRPYNDPSGGG